MTFITRFSFLRDLPRPSDRERRKRRSQAPAWRRGTAAAASASAQARSPSRRPSACHSSPTASVRVLVLPPSKGLGGLGLRRSLEQEAEIARDERVGRRHGVRVVDGPVLAREGDPARVLAQTVLQLSPNLA